METVTLSLKNRKNKNKKAALKSLKKTIKALTVASDQLNASLQNNVFITFIL